MITLATLDLLSGGRFSLASVPVMQKLAREFAPLVSILRGK